MAKTTVIFVCGFLSL